jgi:hypothetical protein
MKCGDDSSDYQHERECASVSDGVRDGCSFPVEILAGWIGVWTRTRDGIHEDTRTGMNGTTQTMIEEETKQGRRKA